LVHAWEATIYQKINGLQPHATREIPELDVEAYEATDVEDNCARDSVLCTKCGYETARLTFLERRGPGSFLVVALYKDTGQRFATSVTAESPDDAERLAAEEADGDITVAAVLRHLDEDSADVRVVA
jgi:hypothetical protein